MIKYVKRITWLSMAVFVFASFTACFGRFALIRKLYAFNESIGDKGTLQGRFINTIVSYVLYIPYGFAGFVDVIILNLIEFWTGSNPIADNSEHKSGDTRAVFTQSADRKILSMNIRSPKGEQSFHFFRDQPGKIFTKSVDGTYSEISMNSVESVDHTSVMITSIISGKTQEVSVSKLAFLEMQSKVMNAYTAVLQGNGSGQYAAAKTSAVY